MFYARTGCFMGVPLDVWLFPALRSGKERTKKKMGKKNL
jgi:hypothetical protein